jgi:hypothetical protein
MNNKWREAIDGTSKLINGVNVSFVKTDGNVGTVNNQRVYLWY